METTENCHDIFLIFWRYCFVSEGSHSSRSSSGRASSNRATGRSHKCPVVLFQLAVPRNFCLNFEKKITKWKRSDCYTLDKSAVCRRTTEKEKQPLPLAHTQATVNADFPFHLKCMCLSCRRKQTLIVLPIKCVQLQYKKSILGVLLF